MVILELYAVRNSDGNWFRAKGYGGYGDTWVGDIRNAKFYAKVGQAKARVTYFANHYPEYGVPELVKLGVTQLHVIDQTERVGKVQKRRSAEKLAAKKRKVEEDIERATREKAALEDKIRKLKRKRI